MLIDPNVFLGPWPFLPVPEHTGAQLAKHLAAHGIRRALVSHLGAVFLPEPMPANRKLFAEVRGVRALLPVPVINPALAAWRDHLAECRAAAPIKAVRILPAYHNYSLKGTRRLDDFMRELAAAKLPVIVQARLEDERNRYFGLTVKNVPVAGLASFLRRHSRQHVLCCGLYLGEIRQLALECNNFSTDLAFAEYLTTAETVRGVLPARRIMLGSNYPLLSTHAQTAKLRHARLPKRELQLMASGNARRFFSL